MLSSSSIPLFLPLPYLPFLPSFSLVQVTPMSDRDFGRYNCTARNNIGMRFQEFILAQAGKSEQRSSSMCVCVCGCFRMWWQVMRSTPPPPRPPSPPATAPVGRGGEKQTSGFNRSSQSRAVNAVVLRWAAVKEERHQVHLAIRDAEEYAS